MKKILYILIVTVFTFSAVSAQDIHFSQYFASPLTTNPANTGLFPADYRVGGIFRQQWTSVPVPYNTFGAFGDMKLLNNQDKGYFIGAGLSLASDRSGDGNLGVNKIMLSGAFHYAMGSKKMSFISVGLQAGWVQKRLDWNKLYFDNQWNEQDFDMTLPSGEPGYKGSFGQPDFQAGAMYTYGGSERVSAYGGISVFHLSKPKDSFYKSGVSAVQKNNLGMRPVFTAGATIKINEKLNIYPSINYMSQKKASEFIGGSLLSYDFNPANGEGNKFFLGAFMRLNDAYYPVAGYEYHRVRALFSYDINYSELKQASHGRGAWEISLVYMWSRFVAKPKIFDFPCPRF